MPGSTNFRPSPKRRLDGIPLSRPHDVVLVISDLSGGGAQRVLSILVDTWSIQGLRVCVITLGSESGDRFVLHPRATRVSLNLVGKSQSSIHAIFANLKRIGSLRKALRAANAPNIVSFLSTTNVLTILATRGLTSRVTVSERNDPDRQPLSWPWRTLRRWTYRYADTVTANSHGALRHLQGFVPFRKLHYLPNPIHFPETVVHLSRRRTKILNVGSLTHQKAQDILLEAYARVIPERPDWSLTIVGDGPARRDLIGLASALNLLDHIEWIHWIEEMGQCYEDAQIFVLPSWYEGTPNALLEAMSFGLPSIVTDASPGPLEHVVDEENGLVVSAGNVQGLAGALFRLMESRDLRTRLGIRARARMANLDRTAAEAAWASVLELPRFTPNHRED